MKLFHSELALAGGVKLQSAAPVAVMELKKLGAVGKELSLLPWSSLMSLWQALEMPPMPPLPPVLGVGAASVWRGRRPAEAEAAREAMMSLACILSAVMVYDEFVVEGHVK